MRCILSRSRNYVVTTRTVLELQSAVNQHRLRIRGQGACLTYIFKARVVETQGCIVCTNNHQIMIIYCYY